LCRQHSFPRSLSAGGRKLPSQKISRSFAKSFFPKNSFSKTEYELKPRHRSLFFIFSDIQKSERAKIEGAMRKKFFTVRFKRWTGCQKNDKL